MRMNENWGYQYENGVHRYVGSVMTTHKDGTEQYFGAVIEIDGIGSFTVKAREGLVRTFDNETILQTSAMSTIASQSFPARDSKESILETLADFARQESVKGASDKDLRDAQLTAMYLASSINA